MLNIEETELTIHGIEKEITLFQLTDMHIAEADEREENRVLELRENRRKCFERPDKVPLTDVFDEFLRHCDEVKADCIVFTGDIIDFPSSANLELLEEKLNKKNRSYLYALGNHDWCYPFCDADERTKALYYPKFGSITDRNPLIQVKDVGSVSLIAIDNTDYQIHPEQLAVLKKEFNKGKPCLLFFHIPIYIDSLTPDTIKVWQYPILMGVPEHILRESGYEGNYLCPSDTTQEFYDIVKTGNPPVAGIFSGHVHFFHTDEYRAGITQYVTAPGVMGNCRKITIKPAY